MAAQESWRTAQELLTGQLSLNMSDENQDPPRMPDVVEGVLQTPEAEPAPIIPEEINVDEAPIEAAPEPTPEPAVEVAPEAEQPTVESSPTE